MDGRTRAVKYQSREIAPQAPAKAPDEKGWHETPGGNSFHPGSLAFAEMKRGAALTRRNDQTQATALEAWIAEIMQKLGDRILPVDLAVAGLWSELMVPDPRPPF